jgi:hypothetical protein
MSAHFGRFVAYFRVSTDKQGESGLGLDAQRQAVMNYLNGGPWRLVAEHTEVESGKRNARPELQKALAACRRYKAKLCIAKLDRLSRNLAFIATLMDFPAWSSSQPTIRTPTNSPSTSWPPWPNTSARQSASAPKPP